MYILSGIHNFRAANNILEWHTFFLEWQYIFQSGKIYLGVAMHILERHTLTDISE